MDTILDRLKVERENRFLQAQHIHDTATKHKRALSANEQERFDGFMAEVEDLDARMAEVSDLEERNRKADVVREQFRGVGGTGTSSRMRGDGFDDARRAIDASFRSGDLPDHAAEKATKLVDEGSIHERGIAARWATATSSRDYLGAFTKLLSDPERGHQLWTPQEADAFRSVREVQSELRAMSLTDANGGYMVPLSLDPSIILTSAGSINPLRQISRVVQTVTDSWQGVSSAGVTAEWIAEGAEVADASPTVGDEPIPVHKGDAFVPFSFEIGDDTPNFVQELRTLLVDAADQLQATAFTTGSGTGQPTGIVTALAGTSSVVSPAVAETFATADVYALLEAVPPRFRANAAWMGNLTVLDKIDQFETTNGAKQFPQAGADPSVILRRKAYENSNMDGAWNVAATADNHILICGDFRNYVIVDRIGTTLELVPHLFGNNNRPTGQRGALLWFRTGADSVNDNAFRMLNLATTA